MEVWFERDGIICNYFSGINVLVGTKFIQNGVESLLDFVISNIG